MSESRGVANRSQWPSSTLCLWWCGLFALGLADALVGYLGRAAGLILLSRPWLLLGIATTIALSLSIRDFSHLRMRFVLCFALVIVGLIIGVFGIPPPPVLGPEGLYTLSIVQIAGMAVAFTIGAVVFSKSQISGEFLADLMLFVAAVHAIVCLLALWGVNPSLFPIIDSSYWRDGRIVSRPEITTDQTRQVLYLIPAVCAVFVRYTPFRFAASTLVVAAATYITVVVQSRYSSVLVAVFVPVAILMGLRARVLAPRVVIPSLVVIAVVVLSQTGRIVEFAADVLWRFGQLDETYGGRWLSITYLFEKLADPSYWIPRGYGEFYRMYGGAPHSFPTMIFLMGGLLALAAYLPLMVLPLLILGRRVWSRTASGVERIAFFMGMFSLALQLTQPVVTHGIFWLFVGATVGALSLTRKTSPRDLWSRSSDVPRLHRRRQSHVL